MEKSSLTITLILLSCICILRVIPYEGVDRGNTPSITTPAIMSYRQNSPAIAQIYIEHSYPSDLSVDLGVGDPNNPNWSISIWNRASGISNLNLTVDISGAVQYLPPSEKNRWFLRVFDAVNGNQGQIEKFKITSNNRTFDSMSIPVAIYDFQVSYSYIPGVPLELAISRRVSIRDFPETEGYAVPEVSSDLLSKVLWAAYGASSWGRTASNICGNYPLIIYVSNKTAVYRYDPDQQALELLRYGDYRGVDKSYFDYFPAPVELFICLDLNKYSDLYSGAMEAGAVIQNIYLQADTLGLGTVCVGGMNVTLFHDVLGLPTSEVVLYNMPLGYPTSWAFYNFTCTGPIGSAELPIVRQSSVLLGSALAEARESHYWSEVPLTSHEVSQTLWSAYGLSYLRDMRPSFWSYQTQHRTIASAGGAYPLEVWMMNSTGTYLYNPWDHYVYSMSLGDKRTELAQSTSTSWVASSPMTLVIVLNTTRLDALGGGRLDWAYTEIGSLVQNVFLESAALGLVADWSKIVDENATSAILGIAQHTDLHPVMTIAMGHNVRSDVAVASIVSDNQTVIQGQGVTINATVANQGSQNETFNVTAYAKTVQIGKRTISNLGPGAAQTLSFSWNTIGLSRGSYTLWAYADPVPGELDVADNNRSCSVTVISTPDITGLNGYPDGKVDLRDISYVARRFMCKPGDSLWDSRADLNGDSKIDLKDIALEARYFGRYP